MPQPEQKSRRHIESFTREAVDWEPYLEPVDLASATPEQLRAMQVTPSNQKISAYVLTLAHDPQSLEHRSPLYNAIMYASGGLPRQDRELAALGTSLVNRCIYCAAIHSSRFVGLTKEGELADAILEGATSTQLNPRRAAILNFAERLSQTPSEATEDDVSTLRNVGLTDLEILDLIHSVAIFGWANRLMHTLGRAVEE